VSDPAPVNPPARGGLEVTFENNAGFNVKNLDASGNGVAVTAFITSFDDQITPIAPIKSSTVKPGKTWSDTFNATCVQLDIDQPGVKLVAAAFFGKDGKKFNPSNEPGKVTECRITPTPPPTCASYQRPNVTINGDPATTSNDQTGKFTISGQGSVLPTGGTFNPPLPITIDYGQSASTTYSVGLHYGPEQLECYVGATKTFTFAPPACDASGKDWSQSEEDNKNTIKFNAHISNYPGAWTLTLYASSQLSEYTNNTPDFTKATDAGSISCKGQLELKVSYGWKDHPSTHWWAVLKRNGVVVYKSPVVVKS
jgi:hypothetical protein